MRITAKRNNNLTRFCFIIFISFLFSTVFSSCAFELVEALSVEEAGVIGGATEGELAAITAEEAAIFDEIPTTSGRLNARLADIKLFEKPGSKPVLYINSESGIRNIAEVENKNTVRLLRNGELKRLPGEIYKVRSRMVNVRSSRIIDTRTYNIKYKVNEGELVLVLSEREGWYTVWLGENKVGYVKDGMALLAAVAAQTSFSQSNQVKVSYKTCIQCNGEGKITQNNKCPLCKGSGLSACYNCHGAGKFVCYNCAGKKKFECYNCHGAKRFVCYNCHGTKKFACYNCRGAGRFVCYNCQGRGRVNGNPCYTCNQSGYTPCFTCNQSGYTVCNTCNQTGYTVCNVCNQTGELPCNVCGQKGITPCNVCNQTGLTACYTCNKTGNIESRILCTKCVGTGRIADR